MRAEALQERGRARVLPVDLEVGDEAGDEDDVGRAVPGHLVRDVHVTAPGVADVPAARRARRRRPPGHTTEREEAVPAAVGGRDEPLLPPAVAESLAGRLDPARERRLAHEPVAPHVVEQLLLRDHPVGVHDQVAEDVEHLRLDPTGLARLAQLEALGVELEVLELEDHPPMMAAAACLPGLNPPRALQDPARPFPHGGPVAPTGATPRCEGDRRERHHRTNDRQRRRRPRALRHHRRRAGPPGAGRSSSSAPPTAG